MNEHLVSWATKYSLAREKNVCHIGLALHRIHICFHFWPSGIIRRAIHHQQPLRRSLRVSKTKADDPWTSCLYWNLSVKQMSNNRSLSYISGIACIYSMPFVCLRQCSKYFILRKQYHKMFRLKLNELARGNRWWMIGRSIDQSIHQRALILSLDNVLVVWIDITLEVHYTQRYLRLRKMIILFPLDDQVQFAIVAFIATLGR